MLLYREVRSTTEIELYLKVNQVKRKSRTNDGKKLRFIVAKKLKCGTAIKQRWSILQLFGQIMR